MNYTFSERMKNMNGTATREIFKLLGDPSIISFAGGNPAIECLPTERVKEIANDICASPDFPRVLQYGLTAGFPEFRELLCKYVETAGIYGAKTENVLVISGGQQGIDLALKAFIDPGDVILVEDPTYLAFLQLANSYEGVCVGVKADENGLDLADLEAKIKKHKPKVLYCVPTFSNPTGKTYSAENRKAIAEMTAKYGVIVLEDDPYSKLRFKGEYLPAMKSYDEAGNIIFISSFSKIISPGNRTGVAVASPEIIRKMEIGKQGTDLHTPNLSQMITYEYLRRGYLEPDLEKAVKIYGEKKAAMSAAIAKYMPEEFECTDPDGGLFIWGRFPEKIDVVKIFPEAIARKVAYIQGCVFFADGSGTNYVRLNYSYASPAQIDEGIARLGELFKEKLAK
ncbi:MAG TPA: PLP-dependent aminotransferase family protein [Candidatus Protoclostridium stercorigallinarum]|uniref:PLP-dependent aminotransferase family protein n=1 Tax=Candidatus Protoclostridium stercorigallinarum TaxID=2838741 RepID=A0A9D1PZ79_9FIRM|nr:PLP-dependent aminotransferase family protein [Candidatus Protoclostridium stercorigallinarum]